MTGAIKFQLKAIFDKRVLSNIKNKPWKDQSDSKKLNSIPQQSLKILEKYKETQHRTA